MNRVTDPVAATQGGICCYCGTALQSATAIMCVRCEAAHTVPCVTCQGPNGGVLLRYRGRDKDGAPRICPRCNNSRVVLLDESR